MSPRHTLSIVVLAGSALLMTGASAQQPAPQSSPSADSQVVTCPPGGPMGPGRGMAQAPGPGMQRGMGPGAGQGMGPGQMGGMMGMTPQDMQQMHQEMIALREEMRQLRDEMHNRR